MNTTLIICLYLLLTWAAFIAVYNGLFRPTVLCRLRFLLFDCRDRVRAMVIAGRLDEQDAEYLTLERACQHSLACLGRPNLLDVLFFKPSQETQIRVKADMQIIENAKPEIRAIHQQIGRAMIGAVFLNSPGLFPLLGFCGVIAIASYWFVRARAVLAESLIKAWGLIYEAA